MIKKKKLKNFPVQISTAPQNKSDRVTLWVSSGEYNVYDNYEYNYMESDDFAAKLYEEGLKKCVENLRRQGKEKISLIDIGTGKYMDWALYAADLGVDRIVALEGMESTYLKAEKTLQKSGYNNIELLNVWSENYHPEEKFDICISEIIGSIGGAEGAEVVLADAKRRFLKEDGLMFPSECRTRAAGVCLKELVPTLGFHPECQYYLENIFKEVGGPFDLRLMLYQCNEDDIKTTHMSIETLNFNKGRIAQNALEQKDLEVLEDGFIDGLLLWIQLYSGFGDYIDSLAKNTAWDHIYIPIFDEPVFAKRGDIMKIKCLRSISDDGVHPDYTFKVNLNGVKGEFKSFHHISKEGNFKTKSIYKQLFT